MTEHTPWWQKTTIYHIYPRSFMDSNNDGIGDLQGIISKLDYIKELGFKTIWLSPFFTSPQQDWGYDISDFLDTSPEYGQLADVERLIEEVHQREMYILFDLVLNHTSEQHPWFRESRSSKNNPKRDWYIWKDGRGSRPPNNWRSTVGGSAWHLDPGSNQWYYASFLPFQPDLNYRNPEVVTTMLGIAKHWFDLGVDGFRLDIFHCLFKDANFRDNPWSTKLFSRDFQAGFFQYYLYNLNQPETIQFACQLRQLADSYSSPKLLLGEIYGDDVTIKAYLGQDLDGLNLVFLWNLLSVNPDADYLRDILQKNESNYAQPYTPVLVYGNHDHLRLMTRIGEDSRLASLLAVFQFTARGVPVTYYGEEIGMSELYLPKNDWKDPVGKRFSWLPEFVPKALKLNATRDGCRSPMQWEREANAGFTAPDTQPWMPVNENYARVNVSSELDQPDSLLDIYQRLLRIRREYPALHSGGIKIIECDRKQPQLLAYVRQADDHEVLVLINFGDKSCTYIDRSGHRQVIFRKGDIQQDENGAIQLEPFSAVILTD